MESPLFFFSEKEAKNGGGTLKKKLWQQIVIKWGA